MSKNEVSIFPQTFFAVCPLPQWETPAATAFQKQRLESHFQLFPHPYHSLYIYTVSFCSDFFNKSQAWTPLLISSLCCLRKSSLLDQYSNSPYVPRLLVVFSCSAHLHPILHPITQNDFYKLILSRDSPIYSPSQFLSGQNPNGIIIYDKDESVPHILWYRRKSKFKWLGAEDDQFTFGLP